MIAFYIFNDYGELVLKTNNEAEAKAICEEFGYMYCND